MSFVSLEEVESGGVAGLAVAVQVHIYDGKILSFADAHPQNFEEPGEAHAYGLAQSGYR